MKTTSFALLVTTLACVACSQRDDAAVAREIALGITSGCPMSDPGDEKARAQCAANMTAFAALRDAIQEPLPWGGQRAGMGYRLDKSTTRFNGLVWRRMYLSLFMFTGAYTIEQVAGYTVLHLPYRFRNKLDIGSYPYPFWHSKAKWDSWTYSVELLLIIQKGKIIGALRSGEVDMTHEFVPHEWNGLWTWQAAGQEMPYVSLYTYLFSPKNPHVAKLDQAYRAFEAESRQHDCLICHSPNNFGNVDQLEFFNYPNQALYARHDIIGQLEQNKMPPDNDAGIPAGIADDAARLRLLELAKAFEKAGDEALSFEGELKEQARPDAGAM